MVKRNMTYYEKTYENLLVDYINASTKEDKEKALVAIKDYLKKGDVPVKVVKAGTKPAGSYYEYKNKYNYQKVACRSSKLDFESFNDEKAYEELKKSKSERRKRYVKRTLYVVGGTVLAGVILLNVTKCSGKNSKNSGETTETTIESTDETTYNTTSTTSTFESTSTTSTFDSEGAVPSMSDAMKDIQINQPSATTSATNGNSNNSGSGNSGSSNNGGSNNGGSNNGGSNNGGSNNGGSSTPTTAEPTTTTTTTPTTTTEPSATTTRNSEVPETTPVETKNTAPSDEQHTRDITVDEHDGKNPEYIEEDPNETYPTYINIPETTASTTKSTESTTAATTKPTTGTVNGMPVEEDPDETYETYFNAGVKTKSLRK